MTAGAQTITAEQRFEVPRRAPIESVEGKFSPLPLPWF
jgi:hypothetical protein